MNVCKTIAIFVRFDSYYVNWTFSKKIDIVVKLICDLIWFGRKIIWIWFYYLWFDLWFAHHCHIVVLRRLLWCYLKSTAWVYSLWAASIDARTWLRPDAG